MQEDRFSKFNPKDISPAEGMALLSLKMATDQRYTKHRRAVRKKAHAEKSHDHHGEYIKSQADLATYYLFVTRYGAFYLLERALKKGVEKGSIGEEAQNHILHALKNQLHPRIGYDELEYRNDYPFENHFSQKEAFVNSVREKGLSAEEVKIVELLMEEIDPLCKRMEELYAKLKKEHFLVQWSSGAFTYPSPILGNKGDMDLFSIFIGMTLGMIDKEHGPAAAKELLQRLENHEQELRDRENNAQIDRQRQEEVSGRRKAQKEVEEAQQRAEDIRRRAETAREQHHRFMATPQPYALINGAGKIHSDLQHYTHTMAKDAGQATILLNAIDSTRSKLDIHNPSIKSLGDLVLSESNLLHAAKALHIENHLQTRIIQVDIPHAENTVVSKAAVRHLAQLYQTSADAREAIHAILRDPKGTLLLATLILSPQRAKQYAGFLADAYRTMGKKRAADEEFFENWPKLKNHSTRQLNHQELPPQVKNGEGKALLEPELRQKINQARDVIAREVLQAMGERNLGAIKAGALPVIASLDEKAETPSEWKSVTRNAAFHEEFSLEKAQNEKFFRISSNQFPDLSIEVKRNAALATLEGSLGLLRAECAYRQANIELLQRMSDKEGFEIADSGKLLRHPEYGISISLEGSERHQMEVLEAAESTFNEQAFKQKSLLALARRLGITITGIDEEFRSRGSITLEHPDFHNITLAPRGYLNSDETAIIHDWVDRLQRKQALPDIAPLKDEETSKDAEPVRWELGPAQNLIFFDANTLDNLAAPRGNNGHTWLDLIKCTARLPNVKIIIPSVVADWEMRGRIATYDGKGNRTGFEQLDERYTDSSHYLGHIGKAIDHSLTSASRATLHLDGTIDYQEGANKNIVIVDTPGTKELYEHIREIMRGPADKQIERLETEIYRHDEGEKAIDRILKAMPFDTHAVIVSDDVRYFREAPRTTGRGMPVAQVSTAEYLQSEILEREPELRKLLNESDPITFGRVKDSINDFRQIWNKDSMRVFGHNRAGLYANGSERQPPRIEDIIHAGMVQKRENGKHQPDLRLTGDGEMPSAKKPWSKRMQEETGREGGGMSRPGAAM